MPPLQETVNRKTEMRVGTRTQRGFVYSSLTRPCPDTTVIQLKGTSKILLSALESLLRASQSAQVTVSCKTQGQPTDTYKHTPRHAHTHTRSHTTAFQQSFGSPKCPRPLFFTLPDTTAAKTSSVKVELKS